MERGGECDLEVARAAQLGQGRRWSWDGHIHDITFRDAQAALAALEQAGYELVEDEDAIRATLSCPDIE